MTGEIIHKISLAAEPIFEIGFFPVTNSLLTSWATVLILVVVTFLIHRSLKQIPKGIQNVFEIITEGALNLCDQVTNDRKITLKVFPLVFTIFFFVLINNWLGILPGVGSIGMLENHDGHSIFIPFIRSGTADLNTTLALGLMAVIGANVFGIFSVGLWKTFNKFINIKILAQIFTKIRKDPKILIIAPVTFFVGILEMIGELAKIASLSFRLFGNVFAGEVLLASMSAILAFLLPIPFIFMEIFIGIIQALIFAMLTLVYFTIASQNHEHDEEYAEQGSQTKLVDKGIVVS